MIHDDTNVLVWRVLFGNFPDTSPLFGDIKRWHELGRGDCVELEVEVSIFTYLFCEYFNLSSFPYLNHSSLPHIPSIPHSLGWLNPVFSFIRVMLL